MPLINHITVRTSERAISFFFLWVTIYDLIAAETSKIRWLVAVLWLRCHARMVETVVVAVIVGFIQFDGDGVASHRAR